MTSFQSWSAYYIYGATPLGQEGEYCIGASLFLYTFKNSSRQFSEMPGNPSQLEEVMCSPYNTRGFLCGECIDRYGPAIFSLSMNCVNCSRSMSRYGILVYLLVQFNTNNSNFHVTCCLSLQYYLWHTLGIYIIF